LIIAASFMAATGAFAQAPRHDAPAVSAAPAAPSEPSTATGQEATQPSTAAQPAQTCRTVRRTESRLHARSERVCTPVRTSEHGAQTPAADAAPSTQPAPGAAPTPPPQ
jgi:hypothetical protein